MKDFREQRSMGILTMALGGDESTKETHTYQGGQTDTTNTYLDMDFDSITSHSHGHHARLGGGNDVYNFRNLDQVSDVVVGRIEDFDYSRDEIHIEGVMLDFNNLPSNVRIVEYNGTHDDDGADPQQWLLIETASGGHVFYALEGARVDMDGTGASLILDDTISAYVAAQERHFLDSGSVPVFANLVDVDYVDPVNIVPDGFTLSGGTIINDVDRLPADVLATILGTSNGDLIAAGLNDDTVTALGGDDTVWGGSGHDTIDGGTGDDLIYGGTGNDEISGGGDNDVLHGDYGSDQIYGGSGDDTLYGGADRDTLFGAVGADDLRGEDGDDTLRGHAGDDDLRGGAGEDVLYGNADNDTLLGGANGDVLHGGTGDDVLDGQNGHDRLVGGSGDDTMTGGSGRGVFVFDNGFGNDTITDFSFAANEVLDFSTHSGVNSVDDLTITYAGSDTVITFGSDSVTLDGTTVTLQDDDFIF